MRTLGLAVLSLAVVFAFAGCSSGGDTSMMKCAGCKMECKSGDMCPKDSMCKMCDKCEMKCAGCQGTMMMKDKCSKCGNCAKCCKCPH